MATPSATIVTVIGTESDTDDVLRSLGELRNVHTMTLKSSDAVVASRRIAASPSPYVLHDADPLEHVASAWVEFFDDQATLGALELEVSTAVSELSTGRRVMPDYYVVLEPESIQGTWRHWWLGALASAAPTRVLPVAASGNAVRQLLRRLPTGRPWPEPARWLPSLQYDIPDRVGLTG